MNAPIYIPTWLVYALYTASVLLVVAGYLIARLEDRQQRKYRGAAYDRNGDLIGWFDPGKEGSHFSETFDGRVIDE